MSDRDAPRIMLCIVRRWIPLAIGILAMSVLVYATVQQDLRLTANDPQIQLAEDTAAALGEGRPYVPPGGPPIDMVRSLAPFLIVFGEDGGPTASSAVLDGATRAPPAGVFEYTRQHGEDRITWQPREGVRIAAVMVHVGNAGSGFVLAGRSLREVEERSSSVLQFAGAGCLAALLASLVVVALFTVAGVGEGRGRRGA